MQLIQLVFNLNNLQSSEIYCLGEQAIAGKKILKHIIEQYQQVTHSIALLSDKEELAIAEINKILPSLLLLNSTNTEDKFPYPYLLVITSQAFLVDYNKIRTFLALHIQKQCSFSFLVHESSENCFGYITTPELFNRMSKQFSMHSYNDMYTLLSSITSSMQCIPIGRSEYLILDTIDALLQAQQLIKNKIISSLLTQKVIIDDILHCAIDAQVQIGTATQLGTGVVIQGDSLIGSNVIIEPYVIINNSQIKDGAHIKSHSVLSNVTIDAQAIIGPFAHIHQNSFIGTQSTIGNYVEVKESFIGSHTKAKHLSYLGNAHIGDQVNIGAGCITCNHDGYKRNSTTIKDNAYVGSNTSLIAPVSIGAHSFVAAGSVITTDVPENSLAIARSIQINKIGYAPKLRKKKSSTLTAPLFNKNEKTSEI